jgi:hypothetical protein
MEMVRQRVTQDFQCVTPSALVQSGQRAFESQWEGASSAGRRLQYEAGHIADTFLVV